jgi:CheY-like chemotaxis protein
MMDTPIKILVVEDEMIIAAKISMHLTNLGYEVTGILPRGEEALVNVEENRPDIVIMDICLKGGIDGIDTAIRMQKYAVIPVIFLTANADETTFNIGKITWNWTRLDERFMITRSAFKKRSENSMFIRYVEKWFGQDRNTRTLLEVVSEHP